jgi:hypothetical protein
MARFRLVLSIIFALGTLFSSSVYSLTYYHIIPAGLSRGSAVIAIILSVIAFALCVRINSKVVGGALTMAGILILLPPVQAIISDGRILVPGPIYGVLFFCPVLILGMVKLARSRAETPPARISAQVTEKKDVQST